MEGNVSPFVSIVTPFYNTEEYLAECIESVLGQTYQNWEYVLVNNKSTDKSAEIARRYAEKDTRLSLVHNTEFLGQVENYNHALRQISPESKYCKMVQADDWIFPRCLEEMVTVAETSANVSLAGSYTLHELLPPDGDRPYVGNSGLQYTEHVVSGKQMLRNYLLKQISAFGSPTCVMYKSKEVRSKPDFFELASPVEDVQACFDLMLKGDFAFVHQVLTFNRRQRGSLYWDASQYDSFPLNTMILAHRHGAALFPAAEYKAVLRRIETAYYLCLARAMFDGRGKAYWRYQMQGLQSIGHKIQPLRLASQMPRTLIDVLGNPKMTVGKIFNVLGRK
jgi:glycosyltransferase involved in cell wall biosynthesis